jgi:hypothetical protein
MGICRECAKAWALAGIVGFHCHHVAHDVPEFSRDPAALPFTVPHHKEGGHTEPHWPSLARPVTMVTTGGGNLSSQTSIGRFSSTGALTGVGSLSSVMSLGGFSSNGVFTQPGSLSTQI